jgi:diguanylate cyclase (GGDEF)-like protein/putative nucleotidyltransferase with HDIG domain
MGMSRTRTRISLGCAIVGVLLAILGAVLVSSRQSTEEARLDSALTTTAGEKAALVGTELERVRALALVTARIPPFSELYANGDSLAARIAAVAGPFREINNALTYDHQLYPSRFVEVGYVDVAGRERARVVRGRQTPLNKLRADVRDWPSFPQGVSTPPGMARITMPFISPTAGVPVTAATTTVAVNGRVRAYVEIELALRALQGALSSDVPRGRTVEIVSATGQRLTGVGSALAVRPADIQAGLATAGHWRLAARAVPEASVADGPWYVVSSGRAPSAMSLAFAPEQAVILLLSLVALVAAFLGFRRGRHEAAAELAAEQRAREEAERLSRIDSLTGLYNRRHVAETIEHELARAGRQGSAVGVLMFDIDFFKRINDAHGHVGGDAVLIEVGRRLRAGVRSWDVVARVGGEEFCVITPEVDDEADLAELADRLLASVAERAFVIKPGMAIPVTISAGVALLHTEDGSAEHAFDCADRALYAAKRRGRNRICRFSQLDHQDLRAEQPACLQLAEALAVAGDLREGATAEHSRTVSDMSAAVAERLGLDDDEILRARLGGLLHDVGKIAVPDGILTKPGKLSEDEWEIMRTHPVVGEQLVRTFPELMLAARAVRNHHERWDGNGYPDRIAGEMISVDARIVCAVDAYSAMISDRPYQPARSESEALAELERCSGKQFDPAVVDALIAVVRQPDDQRPAVELLGDPRSG